MGAGATQPRGPVANDSRQESTGDLYVPALDQHARSLIARIQRDHSDVEAVRALEEHYQSKGDLPSLANLMEGWAGTLADPKTAADAMVKAGDAVLAGLSDRPRAWRLFDRALTRCPGHENAVQRLVKLAQSPAELDVLASTLEHAATRLERARADHSQRARLHHRLAQVYESGLHNPARALGHYREALELDRSLTPAMTAARRIYRQRGKPRSVAILYEMELGVTPDPELRRELLCELAEVYRNELDRLDDAIVALRRALKAVPDHQLTLQALAEAVSERARAGGGDRDADNQRAAELFYQVARRIPRNEARAVLERGLAHAEHPRARAMLREIEGHGTYKEAPPIHADTPQRELDAKQTLPRPLPTSELLETEVQAAKERSARETTPTPIQPVVVEMEDQDAPTTLFRLPPTRPSEAPPEIKDWLTSDDWVLDAEQLRGEELLPITERPPEATPQPGISLPPPPAVPSVPAATLTAPPPLGHPAKSPSARTGPIPAEVIDELLLDAGDRPPVEVVIGASTASNFFTGFTGDLQHGGVYVETDEPLPLGTEVELLIELPGDFEARALGLVDFVRDRVDSEGGSGMGVRFQRLTVDDLELIARFAAERQPLLF